MGKIFNKGLDKDDEKEGLSKRLKNIENSQKKLIRDDDKESIHYTPRSKFDDKNDKYKKNPTKQQYRHKTTKCLELFKNFKSKGRKFDG